MDSNAISTAIADFSFKFFNELDKSKSVVSSPLSAEFLLALLTLGSTGPAHSELSSSLGFANDDSLRSTFSSISSKTKSAEGVFLDVANKIYVREGPYDIQPGLKEDAVNIFDADIEKINFNVSAVDKINTWVESKTNHKIKNLLSKDSVDGNTRLVLVNALYFKGTWKIPFKLTATRDRPFYINENSSVQIPTMRQKKKYSLGFSKLLQAQLLEIPYKGEEASMLVVLPRAIEGLDDVITKLAKGHDLMSDMKNMRMTEVVVDMPKFTLETEIDLKVLLPKLGIRAIFDEHNSGLTKILNSDEPLYVSAAVQKAFIDMNEEGTEAAASTGSGIQPVSAPSRFVADHPFLAFIMVGGAPYFITAYRGPEN